MKFTWPILDVKKLVRSPFALFGWVVGGFFLAAFVFAWISSRPSTPLTAAKPPSALPAHEVFVLVSAPSSGEEMQETTSEAEEKNAAPFLSLTGILYSERGSLALINGKVVPEGGVIKGARIDKITADSVELTYEGRPMTLRSR